MIIILIIVVVLIVFIWDSSLPFQIDDLYGECDRLLKEIRKRDKHSYDQIQKFYGKDLDMIGHRILPRFPESLFYHLKDISTLRNLRERLIQAKEDRVGDTF